MMVLQLPAPPDQQAQLDLLVKMVLRSLARQAPLGLQAQEGLAFGSLL